MDASAKGEIIVPQKLDYRSMNLPYKTESTNAEETQGFNGGRRKNISEQEHSAGPALQPEVIMTGERKHSVTKNKRRR